ncbi:hypothetical protein PMAC_000941 [Pneumocystis sp. 'macacae']|nr:hypothetical protein PMAC_000941 [Pneumocystis sp. 'macacae']
MLPDTAADALLLLRASVLHGTQPRLFKKDRESGSFEETASLEEATHLCFSGETMVGLRDSTRFVRRATGEAFDVQAIYFAWLLRDANVAEYIQRCGEADVRNLSFLEKTDLVAWLDGAPESEHILPLDDSAAAATIAAPAGASARRVGFERPERSPVLLKIYAQERTIASRSTVLRGLKPMVETAVLISRLCAKTRMSTLFPSCATNRHPQQRTNRSVRVQTRPRHQLTPQAETQSSSCRHLPLLSSQCTTSSGFSRTASLYPQNRQCR